MPKKSKSSKSAEPATIPVKKRDKEASKQRLLKAALQVFSKVGYDAATTRMVSARAKLNEALIGRYFEGKQGLLVAVIGMLREEQKNLGLPYPQCNNLEEEILHFLEFHTEQHAKRQNLLRVVISRAILDSKIGASIAPETTDEDACFFIERLKVFQDSGDIRKDIPLAIVAGSLGATAFTMGFLAISVFGVPKERVTETLKVTAQIFALGLKAR